MQNDTSARKTTHARIVVEQLLDERKCTIEELHMDVVESKFDYTQGLMTQINKMHVEHKDKLVFDSLPYKVVDGVTFFVMYCTENKRGLWEFFCPFCKAIHTHGTVPGHRVCHCRDEDSPFDAHGYLVELKKGG